MKKTIKTILRDISRWFVWTVSVWAVITITEEILAAINCNVILYTIILSVVVWALVVILMLIEDFIDTKIKKEDKPSEED